jgi:hypothetical protein
MSFLWFIMSFIQKSFAKKLGGGGAGGVYVMSYEFYGHCKLYF